jgi:BirA family biotin operon repressor/biotin-[acetyl-CoA-carboxylase] ligase
MAQRCAGERRQDGGYSAGTQGDAVVVGIGVNLAQAPEVPDRATFALADLGIALDPDQFANDLAECWASDGRLAQLWAGPLIARWQAAAHPLGTLSTCPTPPAPSSMDVLPD